MSTIKADAIEAATGTNTDLDLAGKGTGVPDIASGFKVGGTAGVPVNNLRTGTDGELITWDASGDPATVAVGTATHVLTSNGAGAAPTFQAAGGGGSWNIISTLDLSVSPATDVTLTGIDTTYETYVYVMSAMTFSVDNQGLSMRIGAGGTPGATDAKYAQHAQMNTSISASYSGSDGKDNNGWSIGSDHGNGAGENVAGTVWFFNPGGSQSEYITAYGQITTWMATTNPATPTFDIRGGAAIFGYGATSYAWDRIQLLCQSGTFLTGRVTLYGVAHA